MSRIPILAKIIRSTLNVAGKLPLWWHYKVGRVVAWFLEKVMRYRRDVILTNLARSFPHKSYKWITRTATEYYRRLGDILAEAVWFGACNDRKGIERLRAQHLYEYTNPDVLFDARRRGGVIMMMAHHCNWEVLGGICEYNHEHNFNDRIDYHKIYVIYKEMSNKTAEYVINENRHAPLPDYRSILEYKKVMRHAIGHKDEHPVYVLIADQFPYKGKHDAGIFMGQETLGMLGGFSLAAKLGFAVLYAREERVSRGHYTLTLEVIAGDATGRDPEEMMRTYYRMLEEDIRKDPAGWLWSHKRWKQYKD